MSFQVDPIVDLKLPQEDCSADTISTDLEQEKSVIPGNIGIVKCSAMVWEHDPLFVRPYQQQIYPFRAKSDENGNTTHEPAQCISSSGVVVDANSLMLQPTLIPRDMFVCTTNYPKKKYTSWGGLEVPTLKNDIDLVGSRASGVGAQAAARLPGGCEYNLGQTLMSYALDKINEWVLHHRPADKTEAYMGKKVFAHQLWKHIGSVLDDRVFVHPSEYQDDVGTIMKNRWNIQQIINLFLGVYDPTYKVITRQQVEHAPRFNYEMRHTQGISFVCPTQERKHIPGQGYTVHWTLEKYLPVWQGQDCLFTYFPHDKQLDSPADLVSNINETLAMRDKTYDYINYLPDRPPVERKDDEHYEWIEGVSNEAYFVPGFRTETDPKKIAAVRSVFNWGLMNYILIEFGCHSENQHYFIEIVKGRTPRLLHVGYQWEDVGQAMSIGAALESGGKSSKWVWVKKCRMIKSFDGLTGESLLKNPFSLSVKHRLGDLIVTFAPSGGAEQTYLVQRFDTRSDKQDMLAKDKAPIVIDNDVVRIHGGNISCSINFSPMTYMPNGSIKLAPHDLETCAHPTDDDVYVTASRIGNSKTGKLTANYRLKELFADNLTPIDYDADVYKSKEIIRNAQVEVPVYQWLPKFSDYGRGWYRKWESSERLNGQVDKPSWIEFYYSGSQPGTERGKMPLFLLQENGSEEPKVYDWHARWWVSIDLHAGSMKMKSSQVDSSVTDDAEFPNCITPTINAVRSVLNSGGKPFKGNVYARPFDIAPLIQSISDHWTTDNLTTINHELQVKCYIPRGDPTGPPDDTSLYSPGDSPGKKQGPKGGTSQYGVDVPSDPDSALLLDEHGNLGALAQKLLAMRDKTMYITVRYWWDKGIGLRSTPWNKLDTMARYTTSHESNDMLIQMTGIGQSPELQLENNKLYMNFTIKDYMQIMRDQKIFNSPFFDGVSDVLAVYELCKMASLDEDPNEGVSGVDRSPVSFITKRLTIDGKEADRPFLFNGEWTRSFSYDLPGSYNTLTSPAMRFRDGEDFESALRKIAERSGKSVYFDRWGVLRLEDNPAKIVSFGLREEDVNSGGTLKDYRLKEYLTPKFNFYTSPLPFDSGIPQHAPPSWYEGTNVKFDPRKHAAHLVYNVVRHKTITDQVFSKIALATAANDMTVEGKKTGKSGLIAKGTTFYDMLMDPTAEGFLGYRKVFWQQEGAFGDYDTIMKSLKHYTKMKYPVLSVTFETYGIPGLKPFDIITLDNALYYILEVSHDIEAETNNWWMTITARWFKEGLSQLDLPKGDLEQENG